MLGTICIQRRSYSWPPRNFWCLVLSIISIHLERQLFYAQPLYRAGEQNPYNWPKSCWTWVYSPLFTRTSWRSLPGEFLLLKQLKTWQPLAVLLPLCQSSAPQPLLQQVCNRWALKKDARACLGAAEVQVLVPFWGQGNTLNQHRNIDINTSVRCLSLPDTLT